MTRHKPTTATWNRIAAELQDLVGSLNERTDYVEQVVNQQLLAERIAKLAADLADLPRD